MQSARVFLFWDMYQYVVGTNMNRCLVTSVWQLNDKNGALFENSSKKRSVHFSVCVCVKIKTHHLIGKEGLYELNLTRQGIKKELKELKLYAIVLWRPVYVISW